MNRSSTYRVSRKRSRCRTNHHISADVQIVPSTRPYPMAITIRIAISHSHSHHISHHCHTNDPPLFVASCNESAQFHAWHLPTVSTAAPSPHALLLRYHHRLSVCPHARFVHLLRTRGVILQHTHCHRGRIQSENKQELPQKAKEKDERHRRPYPRRQTKDHTLPARLLLPNQPI